MKTPYAKVKATIENHCVATRFTQDHAAAVEALAALDVMVAQYEDAIKGLRWGRCWCQPVRGAHSAACLQAQKVIGMLEHPPLSQEAKS